MPKISIDTATQPARCEDELLLSCARGIMDPEMAGKVRELVRKDIDWEYLVRTAARHAITPFLYQSLIACQQAVPSTILTKLQYRFHANDLRHSFLTQELLQLMTQLAAQDIPAIPYKGPVLAASVYGERGVREFCDLDILVHGRDYIRTSDFLISQNYRLVRELGWEASFMHENGVVNIDLHQSVTPSWFPCPLDFEPLWKRRQPISVAGTMLSSLSAEDMLIVLCLQVVKDRVEDRTSLAKICDINELIRTHKGMDWQWIMAESERLSSQRVLCFGLGLAGTLLGTELPKCISRWMQADRSVTKLTVQVRERIFSDVGRSYYEIPRRIRFYFRVRERMRDKLALFRMVPMKLADWRPFQEVCEAQ